MDDKNVKVVVEKLKNGKVNLDVSCDHCESRGQRDFVCRVPIGERW